MLEAVPQLDTLVVAVGGGGLISGMAAAAKALKPGIQVIGVQTLRFPNMYNALKHTTCRRAARPLPRASRSARPGKSSRRR
jgi:threonine dehydratase